MSQATNAGRPRSTAGRRYSRAIWFTAAIAFAGSAICTASARTQLPDPFHERAAPAQLRIIYSFSGGNDGALPAASLVAGNGGDLYGTTQPGGGHNVGTVFKLSRSASGYRESILHAFRGGTHDGAVPLAGLAEDANGALYGTTAGGGVEDRKSGCAGNKFLGCGTVFKLAHQRNNGYMESVVYAFRGAPAGDGVWPFAGLAADKSGAFYGTTFEGGQGVGNVFKLTPSGEASLYAFPFSSSGPVFPDGAAPTAGLLVDDSGALYGTTEFGGMCPIQPVLGCGVVFKLTQSVSGYALSRLYEFQGGADGWGPLAGLVADNSGALYGTTQYGGPENDGVVFKLTPSGSTYTESVVHAFSGGNDGALPAAGLIADASGSLYGTTAAGGAANAGTIFKLTPSGTMYVETVLHAFHGHGDGAEPVAGLTRHNTGVLYGTTMIGGAHGVGTAFALTQ